MALYPSRVRSNEVLGRARDSCLLTRHTLKRLDTFAKFAEKLLVLQGTGGELMGLKSSERVVPTIFFVLGHQRRPKQAVQMKARRFSSKAYKDVLSCSVHEA